MTGWKKWLLAAALLLLLAIFLRGHLPEARAAAGLLRAAHPWPLLAALGFQLLYYVFAALVVRQCLRLVDFTAPFGWTLRATMVLIFVSRIVPGPAAAGPAAMYVLLERRGLSRARSALVGPLFYGVDYAVFLLLLATGLGALAARGRGGAEALAALPVFGSVLTVGGLAWWFSGHPRRLEAVLERASRFLNALAAALRLSARVPPGLPREAAETVASVRGKMAAHPGITIGLAGAGLAMVLCDVASMACVFLAFGVWVGIPTAFLGFCLAAAGALVSLLPAGLGTFDAAMVLGFTGLGVPRPATLAATVGYRVLATWLPAMLGVFAWRTLFGGGDRGRVF